MRLKLRMVEDGVKGKPGAGWTGDVANFDRLVAADAAQHREPPSLTVFVIVLGDSMDDFSDDSRLISGMWGNLDLWECGFA